MKSWSMRMYASLCLFLLLVFGKNFSKKKKIYTYRLLPVAAVLFLFTSVNLNASSCTHIGDLSASSHSYSETIYPKNTVYYSIDVLEDGTINSITVNSNVDIKLRLSNTQCGNGDLIDHWSNSEKSTHHEYSGPLNVSAGDRLYIKIKNVQALSSADVDIDIDFSSSSSSCNGCDCSLDTSANDNLPGVVIPELDGATGDVTKCISGSSENGDKDYYNFVVATDGILKINTSSPNGHDYYLKIGKTPGGDEYYGSTFPAQNHEVPTIVLKVGVPIYIYVKGSGFDRDEYQIQFNFKAMKIVDDADDFCYVEPPKYSGFFCVDMGFCKGGMGCKTTYTLKNIGDSPISEVEAVYDETGLGGTFASNCGVDPSGSCHQESGIDMGPVGVLGKTTVFDIDGEIGPDQNSEIWTEAMFSGSCFNGSNLYGSYIKNGEYHRGKLKACKVGGYRPFTLRHREVLRGNMLTIGNTILVAPEDQSSDVCESYRNGPYLNDTKYSNTHYELCAYYDDDNVDFPTTTAQLPLPNGKDVEIVWAGLYWQALVDDSYDVSQMQIKIKHSGEEVYYPVNYDQLDSLKDVGAKGYISYSAFADVTNLFKENGWKAGNITVGDIPVVEGKGFGGLGTYGAWTLVVIYKKDDEKFRAINVYDGWQQVDSDHPEVDIPISNFITPKTAPISAQTSVFTAEGDKYIWHDYLKAKPSKKSTWTLLSHTTDQTFYSAIISPVNFSRSPHPSNNQGIDIQTFDLGTSGKNIIEPQETKIDFKFGSDQDRYWPSMISFSAELRVPNLCYDYAYKQDGRYFTEENNGSQDPRLKGQLFSLDPIDMSLYIKNREESDLVLKNIEINVSDIDTQQATYIQDSAKYIPPGAVKEETPSNVSSSDSFVAADIGGLGSKEALYFYYQLKPKVSSVDMPINAALAYDMIITLPDGSGTLTFHYPKEELNARIPFCAKGGFQYNPVYGNFNVEEAGLGAYNLFTQVSKRIDDFEIKAYQDDGTGNYDTPLNHLSTIVGVEVIDMGAFHETKTSCEEPINTLTPRVWMIFDNTGSVALNKNTIQAAISSGMTSDQMINTPYTLSQGEDFFTEARRNAAFRISYSSANDGSLLTFTKLQNGKYKPNNFPDYGTQNCNEAFSQTHQGAKVSDYCNTNGMNAQELAECMECIYGSNLHYVCSRDNFAIRPKAIKVSLTDDNTSTIRKDFANNFSNTTGINLIAGYPYRFDINATDYMDKGPVKGYVQRFDSTDPLKRAYMQWTPKSGKDVSGCNAPDDRNMTFSLVNGTNTNSNPLNTWGDRHDMLDNVGEYAFGVVDEEWTRYDWESNLTAHHNHSHFYTVPDCIRHSNKIPKGFDERVGCETNSTFGAYTLINIRSYPARYDVSGLKSGARPANITSDTFVYMNTMDISAYPNVSKDENMSYNIQGIFRAVGDDNKTLSNFVKGCYADDTNMILKFEPIVLDENTTGMYYDLYDYNLSNFIREDYELPDSNTITQGKNRFAKLLKGSINMDLGYNYIRAYDTVVNPIYIHFSELNITDAEKPAILYAHGVNNYKIEGSYKLDQNITFIYGRAKPNRFVYDDVKESNITTPVSLVAYCNLGLNGCLNRGLDVITGGMLKNTRSNENNWWIVQKHNEDAGDGNVLLKSTSNGKVSPAAPTPIDPTGGIDSNILVSHTVAILPDVVDINLASGTDRWLIYNKNGDTIPSPFYRVRFIGTGSGWTGYGKTGHVTGGSMNSEKTRRLEW
ncbi:hypothetical protein [Nitratifractor sp.]